MGSLEVVAEELRDAVDRSRVSCDGHLAVERGTYYAQVLFNRDVVFGEVVSNTYLSGADTLTAAQERHLLHMGWTAPDVPCHSRCARSHPNFHRTWNGDVPTGQIVRDLLLGFLCVSTIDEGDAITLAEGYRSGDPSTGLPCSH